MNTSFVFVREGAINTLLVTLVLCTVIKDNATLFGRRDAARREWISLAQGIENVVSIFFIGTVMVDMTFSRCQIQKRSLAFFQDFILERDVWNPQFEMARPIISNWVFRIPCQKRRTQSFFSLFSFASEKSHVKQKETVFWVQANDSSHKPWNATFSVMSPRNIV